MSSIVAIVGRPNVGKSSLFNILTGSRTALVADFSGLTRDRQYGSISNSEIILIDTGGMGKESSDLSRDVIKQTEVAIKEADILFFVVDGKDGLLSLDEEIAMKLRKTNKQVMLIVNKIDNSKDSSRATEFDSLGFKDKKLISCAHNQGFVSLRSSLDDLSPTKRSNQNDDNGSYLKISIVGRPNVGKSTLINKMIGLERVVVSPESGTTRDSIEIPVQDKKIILVDTAGVRKKRVSKDEVEQSSVYQSISSIKKSDVVMLMIDSEEPFVDQDMHLLGLALTIGKPVLVVANKIDLLSEKELNDLADLIERKLNFAKYIGVSLISAKKNQGLKKLLGLSKEAYLSSSKDLDTSLLNRLLTKAIRKQEPPLSGRFRPKLRYVHQGGKNPPLLIFHGSNLSKLPHSYKKFIENYFREALGLLSTPVFVEFREGENPYKDKPNLLTDRQKKKRKRLIKKVKK